MLPMDLPPGVDPAQCIYPTYTCFDDALQFLLDLFAHNPQDQRHFMRTITLVHGICVDPEGKRYSHAWVEYSVRGECIFRGRVGSPEAPPTYLRCEKQAFYQEHRVEVVTRYSMQAVRRETRLHGTSGPWKEAYQALCR